MPSFSTRDHIILPMIAWDPERPAVWINDHIAMVHATSNAYLITGDDGDVIINTGMISQGPRIREKFEKLIGRSLDVAKLVFTQSHPDHMGGWQAFAAPGTELFGQQKFEQICRERNMLVDFFRPRNARVLASMTPPGAPAHKWFGVPNPDPMTTFSERADFLCSGKQYSLFSMPSGETLDALIVWMPEEKIAFTGNWAGAIHGALPNFYTARGDRDRSVPGWLTDCDKLLALEPELLITGHEEPIQGWRRIETDLRKMQSTVRFIHDHTVEGMTNGIDLPTIMQTLKLPASLEPRDGRCPPHWIARSVWEEYAGWFHHERTSELYPTPQSVIWADIAQMAGGAESLAAQARSRIDDDPEKALHFIEMAVVAEPTNPRVRAVEIAVYEALIDNTQGKPFDLVGWLEGRLINAEAALAAANALG